MIHIHFGKGGTVELRPANYAGKTCHDATKPYEKRFGGNKTVTEGEAVDAQVSQTQVKTQQLGNK
jgi:hypothetical protein